MRRKLTYCLAILMAVVFNANTAFAATDVPDDKRPFYHINENFEGKTAADYPKDDATSGIWKLLTDGNAAKRGALGGNWGGFSYNGVEGRIESVISNQKGPRGGDLWFPSPQSNTDFLDVKTFVVEFDWTYVTSGVRADYDMGYLIGLGGSNSVTAQESWKEGWFFAGILGLYTFGDGYLYCWNLDPVGDENGEEYKRGPIFKVVNGAASGHNFARRGTSAELTLEANASCKTNIPMIAGMTYHIRAVLNFETQKVEALSISYQEAEAEAMTEQVGTNMDFIAKTCAHTAVEDRTVNDVSNIFLSHNRTINFSATSYFDNVEIYTLVPSEGKADVTIKYVDQDGLAVKEPRVVEDLYVGTDYALIASDKERFQDDLYFYAYNKDATVEANGGEFITVAKEGSTLTVIFEKTAKTFGTYVWTGATNNIWSETDANFSVNEGPNIPYQVGNPIEFPKDMAGEVLLKGSFSVGNYEVNVKGDYIFSNFESGVNALLGDSASQFIITEGNVILGFDCKVPKTVVFADSVTIVSSVSAQKIIFKKDNSKLIHKSSSTLNIPIEYDKEIIGGTLDFDLLVEKQTSSTFTNIENLNVNLYKPGRRGSAVEINTSFIPSAPFDNMKINVFNKCTDVYYNADSTESFTQIATFAISDAVAANSWVNLGENTRLARYYNEANTNASVTQVGLLTGGPTTVVAPCVVNNNGRVGRLQINGIDGLESKFEGRVTSYYEPATPETFYTRNRKGIYVGPDAVLTLSGKDYILEHGIEVAAGGKVVVNGQDIAVANTITLAGELELNEDLSVMLEDVFYLNDSGDPVADQKATCATTINSGGKLVLNADYLVPNEGQNISDTSKEINVNDGGILKAARGVTINTLSLLANTGSVLEGDINVPYSISLAVGNGADIASAVWKATVSSFTDGDYDRLVAQQGDFNVSGDLDITVVNATEGAKAKLFGGANVEAKYHVYTPGKVLVNGVDIAEAPEGADYVWVLGEDENGDAIYTGELLSKVNKVSIGEVDNSGKEVKSVQYYDFTGSAVSEDASGFVIQKTIYIDGTSSAKKMYVPAK
ncbi:hypothetical protein LJB91_01595 [Bacteroidales bacterium OttesenSCG-928-L03]|nr:hypothetical protein [Bacteroidales bacterium OttesenSCG-928-L03]